MTKPRELQHAPHCERPEPRAERIGTWTLTRCPTCRATGIRRTETTEREIDR